MPVTQLRRPIPALALVASILALTACTGSDPTPPTRSSPPPVFANEEEALAAVTETYQQFLDTANLILHEGGSAPERISAIMAPEVAEVELEAYGRMRDNGYRSVGDITLADVQLREFYSHPDALGVVARAFACEVISSVEVVDASDQPISQPGRAPAVGFDVSLGLGPKDGSEFIILSKEAEEGASACV
ncbi:MULTISPECIES: hypothetical protein [unclassified Plantibacter]|uniref:hypothetical protein n=1 Tax=unclassified Plantibacter TaxID=2624265 RepID=UPI000B11BBDB|nr:MULTISPECIES: hypothetical protein [unclassified Plantibacter]